MGTRKPTTFSRRFHHSLTGSQVTTYRIRIIAPERLSDCLFGWCRCGSIPPRLSSVPVHELAGRRTTVAPRIPQINPVTHQNDTFDREPPLVQPTDVVWSRVPGCHSPFVPCAFEWMMTHAHPPSGPTVPLPSQVGLSVRTLSRFAPWSPAANFQGVDRPGHRPGRGATPRRSGAHVRQFHCSVCL